MGEVLKFEKKEKVLLMRVIRYNNTQILALQLDFLEKEGHEPINYLLGLEEKGYFFFEEIGLTEIFPSMKGYFFCKDENSFNSNLIDIYNG